MLRASHYKQNSNRRAAVFEGAEPIIIVNTLEEAKALAKACNHDLYILRKKAHDRNYH
jgi:hypothetical protein